MGEFLRQDTLAATIADLERRMRTMEATQRVGLNQMRWCQQTASAVPSVFGSNEYGTVGNTWLNDLGGVGTGYPTLTMVTSAKVLMFVGCEPINVGNAAGFRSRAVTVSVKIDANENYMQRYYYQANIDRMFVPFMAMNVPLPPLTPGVAHTFTVGASWENTNPAAGTLPYLLDTFLFVLPLSAS